VFLEDSSDLEGGKGTREATGMLKIISERALYVEEQTCACFTGWQKAFDRVNWTELMQILKGISMNWRVRRFISKMYVEQSVQLRMEHGGKTSVKNGRGVKSRMLFVTGSIQLLERIPYPKGF
jgi:hypothetical protein